MIYDTHCHPNLANKKLTNYIIENFKKENPKGFLNAIWTNLEDSEDVIKISRSNPNIFCSIWIHPTDSIKYSWKLNESLEILEKLYIKNKDKVVAIWECWLDYYWMQSLIDKYKLSEKEIKKIQKDFFIAQIKLAKKYNLPIIIHNRNTKDDILKTLIENNYKNFIFHCYTEDFEYAMELISFSPECKISFSWIVTFNNAEKVQETAKKISLKNILIETDSPFLTPTPYRWKEENEPIYVKYVLEKIIKLRKEPSNEIRKQIFKNSLDTFF